MDLGINNFFRKGGLKLKFISVTVFIIIFTVLVLSSTIIHIMSSVIEKKAFESTTNSINRLGDFSKIALLERSEENKVNLSEIIKELHESKIDGFLDISIYEREKDKKDYNFVYVTGFKQYDTPVLLEDEKLIDKLHETNSSKVFVNEIKYKNNIDVYQFVKPITYNFKNQDILLGTIVLIYDKSIIYRVINQVISTATFITLLIVLISIVIVYWIGSRFTKPILLISEAANSVSKGNFNIDLKIDTNDEIEILAQRFNKMVNGLREREMMQKFVSGSTMNMIQKDRKAELILGGEYRKLTFLFSDIRGFTAMSETKKPDEVVEIVNFYLNLQSDIIKRNGGDIDKFIGDEIMASFGGEDSLQKAVDCAIQIQKEFASENKKREKIDLTTCEVGIGINSGEVIVGNIGSYDRMDFTSIGLCVNLASRLCSIAQSNEILVEEEKANILKDKFKIVKKDPIVVKGFSKVVDVSMIVF